VRLWDPASGDPLAALEGHDGAVSAVTWHGGLLVSAGWDGTIRAWNLLDFSEAWVFQAGADVIDDVAWNPGGMTFATAGWDGSVRLWYTRDMREGGRFDEHTGPVHDLAWNPDGTALVSLGWDDTAMIWEVSRGRPGTRWDQFMGWVGAVGWTADGHVTSASLDRRLRTWDPATGDLIELVPGTMAPVSLPAASPDGAREVDIDEEGIVRVTAADTGAVIATLPGRANAAAWSPAGDHLAVAARDGTIVVWAE